MKILYITTPNTEVAHNIAENLLEASYASCVNILPQARSIYKWQGELKRETEIILIAKIPDAMVKQAINKAEELHPYQTPAILVLNITDGSKNFLQWVDNPDE